MSAKVSRWRTQGVRVIRADELTLHCELARSGQQGLVVNLDITPVEMPELIRWVDDLHR